MRHAAYLLSILIFCGVPLILVWRYERRILKRYELLILSVMFIGVLYAASEYFALQWQAWRYNPDRIFDIRIGAEIETYVLGGGTFSLISAATIVFAALVDRRRGATKKEKRHSIKTSTS